MASLVVALLGCRRESEEWIPVLGQPPERCHPKLGDSGSRVSREEVIVGVQVAFADRLRKVTRPQACAGSDWIIHCQRPARSEQSFRIEKITQTFGDARGYADIRFQSGDRWRVCFGGPVFPLDGSSFSGAQSMCPKSHVELLKGLPEWCTSDPALVPAEDEDDVLLCRNYQRCPPTLPSARSAPSAPVPSATASERPIEPGRLLAQWDEGGIGHVIRYLETATEGAGGLYLKSALEVRQEGVPGAPPEWSFRENIGEGLRRPLLFRPAFARVDVDGDGKKDPVFGFHGGKESADPVEASLVNRLGSRFVRVDGKIPVSEEDASLGSSTLAAASAGLSNESAAQVDRLWQAFVARLCLDPDVGLSLPLPPGITSPVVSEYQRQPEPAPPFGRSL